MTLLLIHPDRTVTSPSTPSYPSFPSFTLQSWYDEGITILRIRSIPNGLGDAARSLGLRARTVKTTYVDSLEEQGEESSKSGGNRLYIEEWIGKSDPTDPMDVAIGWTRVEVSSNG